MNRQLARLLAENPDLQIKSVTAVPENNDTADLLRQIAAAGLPEPQTEYLFDTQRKWRIDLAWPESQIAMEIEGGVWMRTKSGRSKGHAHPKRFMSDMEKYNEVALSGFCLLRVTPGQARDGTAVNLLLRAFGMLTA